ncbi:Uncharacterised protein [Cronobacter sakazakii]|nr:Uncharacterised protein [Cronobacter sakazakii]
MDGTSKIEIEDYNEDGFWSKVKKYCKAIGKDSLEQVLRLYYALDSENCTAKTQSNHLRGAGVLGIADRYYPRFNADTRVYG